MSANVTPATRLKGLLANLAAMAFGLVLGLLALEFGLRLAGFRPPSSHADAVVGTRFTPGARYHHVGEEGSSEGRFNSAGWRDAEHAEAAAPGTTRILFLGDSFVSAFQVPLDSTFHRRLEAELNARALPGHRFEVIALGQDGNGTTAEFLTYKTWGVRYRPDVVAVLFIQNDPGDNSRESALDKQRPFFVEDGDSLRLDDSFTQSPAFRRAARPNWVREHFALWTVLRTTVERLRAKNPPRSGNNDIQGGYYSSWNFAKHPPADSIPAFRLTGKIYERFAREVAADGPRFVVFESAFAQQEDQKLLAANRADPNFDANKAARWLMSVGARDGFPVIPLSPAYRAASIRYARPLWFGHDSTFGHWNVLGHRVAADAMARYFARTLPGLDTTGTTPADVPGLAELEKY
jgi:hypothetical protein